MNLGNKITLGIIGSVIAAVGFYFYKQSRLLNSMCYDFVTVTYEGTVDGIMRIGAVLRFSNYADYPITIKSYDIDVLVDGQQVAKLKENIDNKIPAKGKADVSFLAQTNPNTALTIGLQTLIEQLIDGTSSILTIKGGVSISTGIVSVDNYPIDYSTSTQELINGVKNESEKCPNIT